MYNFSSQLRAQGKKLGFVPTMGALHAGHMKLISNSLGQNNTTVCCIFVNPTQFNDSNDFEKYPITIEKDLLQLERSGCDILFLPTVFEIYPSGTSNLVHYELGRLETVLEGKFRPGHFQGVCQVVDRLLEIVNPSRIYMGQKDFQQCLVVQKMLDVRHPNIEMIKVPIQREHNGLAMSSRNIRLSESAKKSALTIFEVLTNIKYNWGKKAVENLIQEASLQIENAGFEKIDYVSIVEAKDLEELVIWDANIPAVALVAAFIDGVRLIDNLSIS